MVLISVVIPTFNRAAFIERAVLSVLNQTHTDLELVVVDDGSTDHTPDVLALLQNGEHGHGGRLRVIWQENKGVSAARNVGLAHCSGDYYALLDSDDHWLPKKLERQLAFMRDNGFAISQTDEIWYRKGKRVNPMNKHAKPSGEFFEKALKLCLVSPSCVMFTKEFWREVGPFDEKLLACEDYDLWLRTLLRYEVGLLSENLVVREGGRADQLSGRIIGLDLYRIYALVKILKDEKLQGNNRVAVIHALEKKAGVYVRGCLKRHRPLEATRVKELVVCALRYEDCK